jgi:hypothetical protein
LRAVTHGNREACDCSNISVCFCVYKLPFPASFFSLSTGKTNSAKIIPKDFYCASVFHAIQFAALKMKIDDYKKSKPLTFRPTIFTARWLADRRAEGWNQSAIINNALANFIKNFKHAK